MAEPTNKTAPRTDDIDALLQRVVPEARREEARALDQLFRRVTGYEPVIWGRDLIGYGRYHYRYESGREGDFLATGFAVRKSSLVVYILPGYADFGEILKDLGKHKIGKSCIYFNKLSDVDTAELERLIRAGLADLASRWQVLPR